MKRICQIVPFLVLIVLPFNLSAQVFIELNINQAQKFSIEELYDTTGCSGTTLTIGPEELYYAYHWNTEATANSINVDTAGSYVLKVFNSNNCYDTDTIEVDFEDCTTVDLHSNLKLKAFPVPNKGELYISIPDINDVFTVELYNASGEKVFHNSKMILPGKLNIQNIPSGIYFLIVKNKMSGTLQQSIIID